MFWNDVGGVVDFMCAGMIQDGADSVCWRSCRFCVLDEL